MAGLTRLELATFHVTGERSNQTELQSHTKFQIFREELAPRAGLEPAT